MRRLEIWVAITAGLAGCGRLDYNARPDGQLAEGGLRDAGIDAPLPDAPQGPVVPIELIQAVGSSTGSAVKLSATFTNPVHVGDVVIVAIDYFEPGATVTSIIDSLGSTYAIAVPASADSAPNEEVIAYAVATTAGLADDVTVTFSVATQAELRIHEFAGLSTTAPLDPGPGATGFAMGTGSPPDLLTGPAITTTTSNELVFGFELSGIATNGPGWTLALDFDSDITEFQIEPAPGTFHPTAQQTDGPDWWISGAAFRGQ